MQYWYNILTETIEGNVNPFWEFYRRAIECMAIRSRRLISVSIIDKPPITHKLRRFRNVLPLQSVKT